MRFDSGRLSSDGGVVALREVEKGFGVVDRLAACLVDPHDANTAVTPWEAKTGR